MNTALNATLDELIERVHAARNSLAIQLAIAAKENLQLSTEQGDFDASMKMARIRDLIGA